VKKKEKAKGRSKQRVIYLHDQVMEMKLGRPLKKTERVIFLNNDTLDCRRNNLRLVDESLAAQ
jgi:hypothetical protein